MRKTMTPVLCVVFFSSYLNAQSVTPSVINSTGGSASIDYRNFMLDWSVGEMTLVNTLQGTSNSHLYILSNGFLQPNDMANIKDNQPYYKQELFTATEIKVYPNPTNNYVELSFQLQETGTVRLTLFNAMGQQLYSKQLTVDAKNRVERIPMNTYAQGSYVLNVQLEDAGSGTLKKTGVYKIIKTD